MRTSPEQVRHATVDAVDAAKHRASGLVSTGADLVTTTLDKGASVIEGGIERVADHAPVVSVGTARPKRRHRVRTTLIALGVLVAVLAVAKKLMAQPAGVSVPQPDSSPAPTVTSDEDSEPVASGAG